MKILPNTLQNHGLWITGEIYWWEEYLNKFTVTSIPIFQKFDAKFGIVLQKIFSFIDLESLTCLNVLFTLANPAVSCPAQQLVQHWKNNNVLLLWGFPICSNIRWKFMFTVNAFWLCDASIIIDLENYMIGITASHVRFKELTSPTYICIWMSWNVY